MATPYTPYPAPTPWINQPYASNYSQSQAIQSSGSPQGFVVNSSPVGPAYVSPASASQPLSQSYPSVISSQPMASNPSSSSPSPSPAPSQSSPSGGQSNYWSDSENKGFLNGQWYNDKNQWLQSGGQVSGPSQAEIDAQMNRAIDDAYNPQMGYLNDAESMLRRDYPTVQAELEAQTKANAAQLAGNKQKAIAGTEKNITEAKGRKEDALSQARRLFSELQRGNMARFGGTSSAGQAASEIQGQEMQRQFGGTQRDFGKFMQDVQAQQSQIETDYNTALLQQEQTKQTALNQANRDFQSKLLEIGRLKAETESNKAMKRLQALQDLRNQVFAVNQQNTQFQQQLEAAKYQQQLQLQTYQQQLAGQTSPSYVQGGIDYSRAGGTTGANQPVNQYTGSISSKRPEDIYSGAVSSNAYPVASLPDGRMRYSDGTVK